MSWSVFKDLVTEPDRYASTFTSITDYMVDEANIPDDVGNVYFKVQKYGTETYAHLTIGKGMDGNILRLGRLMNITDDSIELQDIYKEYRFNSDEIPAVWLSAFS